MTARAGHERLVGTVLLTGASGFIAKHIALQLLQAGYCVRGTLRSPGKAAEVRDALRPHLADWSLLETRLDFATADLLSDDGWDQAMDGVDALIHTASPFAASSVADENALIAPAVGGTFRALGAARRAGVGRAIVTSSMAAIMEPGPPPPDRLLDEDDWSDAASPLIGAYAKSKTLAERAAWDFVSTEAPEMALTVINPGLVVGAPLDIHFGTAFGLLRRIVRSQDPAVPNIGFSCVDVLDAATLHVRALSTPESVGKRIIAVAGYLTLPEMAAIVAAEFPERAIVTRPAPGDAPRRELSNARAWAIFGCDFIPAADAVRATAHFLVESGLAD